MRSVGFISVIIPTYNRARLLPALLDCLYQQNIDQQRSEVIVIDDGSTDSTWAVLQAFLQGHPTPWLRVLTQNNQGQAAARQYGVSEARGDIVLFLDDDMEARDQHFLSAHLAFHETSSKPTVAYGAILPPKGNPYRQAFELFYEQSIQTMYDSFQQGTKPEGKHFFSANVSLPKKLFLEAGGFDPTYKQAEDRELGLRLQYHSQAEFSFLPEAAAYHNSQTGRFRSFMQRARLYGHYDLQIALKYPDQAELHPRQIFSSKHRLKQLLTQLAWRVPSLVLGLSWLLVLFAKCSHRIGADRFAVNLCSAIYCLQYVDGYRLSPFRTQDHAQRKESGHDAA